MHGLFSYKGGEMEERSIISSGSSSGATAVRKATCWLVLGKMRAPVLQNLLAAAVAANCHLGPGSTQYKASSYEQSYGFIMGGLKVANLQLSLEIPPELYLISRLT